MLNDHGYNVENVGDFVADCTCISLAAWENEKLSETLKINGEDFRVSESMLDLFKRIAKVDKILAKKVIIRSKLIWEYMQFRQTLYESCIPEFPIPAGTERGYVTLWELFEADITGTIVGEGISAKFYIYHRKDFPNWPSIRVHLFGPATMPEMAMP